ncbi:hypothetical protein ACYUML_004396 [Aeromonas hydrophila]
MSTYGLDDTRWFNNVSGAMLGYSSAFGMSVMEGREGAGNTDIRRYMIATRRKAYKALSELLEHADSDWAGNVIHELVKEYEGILAALNEGSALTLSLDWLNLLSKRHPEALHRHVRTMIKAIHRQEHLHGRPWRGQVGLSLAA